MQKDSNREPQSRMALLGDLQADSAGARTGTHALALGVLAAEYFPVRRPMASGL